MTVSLKDKEIIKTANKTLLKYKLCDHCLGRVFAKVEHGLTNQRRGKILRGNLKNKSKNKNSKCWLCDDLFKELQHFADLVLESIEQHQFNTLLIGSKVDEDVLYREQQLYKYTGDKYAESVKTELNREIGKLLEEKLGKEVDFKDPDIMAVVDTAFDNVYLQIKSLFIYGRYKKYARDIPQTRWFCRICQGKGCRKCNYSGQTYKTSVEELIAKNFLIKTKGDDQSFHGCGREDIDVCMLGNGRPFILEIKKPKLRKIDFSKMESTINNQNTGRIAVSNLRFSDKDEIIRIKKAAFRKKYRVVFNIGIPINNEKLKKAVESLRGSRISQFTPSRVAHRRANMAREKQIYDCNLDSIDGTIATLTLEAESGTYIKELVTGDNAKTKPNISDILGAPCKVIELDVIEIKGE